MNFYLDGTPVGLVKEAAMPVNRLRNAISAGIPSMTRSRILNNPSSISQHTKGLIQNGKGLVNDIAAKASPYIKQGAAALRNNPRAQALLGAAGGATLIGGVANTYYNAGKEQAMNDFGKMHQIMNPGNR